MKGTAPVAAAALAVGVGLGYLGGTLLGHGPAAPPALAAPDPASATAPATATAPAPAPAAVAPAGAVTPADADPAARPLSSEATQAIAAAAAAMAAPKVATGTGVITGSVTTADGQPLAGVLVRATPYPDWKPGKPTDTPPADPALEATVAEAVANWRRHRAERREARTGADGAYRLEGLTDARHGMAAWLAGYEIEARDQTSVHQARIGTTVDFVATTSVAVRLDVRLPDGRQPTEARIVERQGGGPGRMVRMNNRGPWIPWAPADPSVRLGVGTHRLIAESGGDDSQWGWNPNGNSGADLRSDEAIVTVEAGAEPAPVTLQLTERPGIKGHVRVPPGDEVEFLMVYHLRQPASGTVDVARLKREGRGEWCQPQVGVFAFTNLTPGTYVIGASRSQDGPVVVMTTVAVADRMVTQDLVLPTGDTAGGLTVRVLGPAGESLADAQFSLTLRGPRSRSMSGASATRRKDGAYRVEPSEDVQKILAGGGADGAKVLLGTTTPSHGTREVEVATGAGECTVRFGPPATVDVTVSNYVGSGHEGHVTLTLVAESGADDDGDVAMSHQRVFWNGNDDEPALSPEGRQRLGPVQEGRYEIVVGVARGGERAWGGSAADAARVAVTLKPGTNAATVTLPTLYLVTVTVQKGEPGMNLMLGPADGGPKRHMNMDHQELDAAGKASFGPVPAGSYVLQAWGEGISGQMTIQVPAQTEVVFEPQAINALRVTIADVAGTLGAAGLRSGDLVIGVDGVEFKSPGDMGRAFQPAAGRTDVKLLVDRGGKRLEVTIAAAKLGDHEHWGGAMEPTAR